MTAHKSHLLTTATAARSLGVAPGTLTRWRAEGRVRPATVTAGGHARWDLDDLNRQLSTTQEEPVSAPATTPEPQPVVAAIVVSEHGALVGKRNDGKPPWTFIAGEIEPGESPTDAVVREVKEETGLLVQAAHRPIGRRVHPKTGRLMIYLECWPTHDTDVWVGDAEELAEVRWIPTVTELDQLLPGMFEPVRKYLSHALS